MSIKFPKGTSVDFITDFLQNLDRFAYHELVIAHLEYIGFPDYAVEFNAELAARTIVKSSDEGMRVGLSPRMVALVIFGSAVTAIQEHSTKAVKH